MSIKAELESIIAGFEPVWSTAAFISDTFKGKATRHFREDNEETLRDLAETAIDISPVLELLVLAIEHHRAKLGTLAKGDEQE